MAFVKTLVPPGKSRERILGFGHEGSGKSSGILSIARAIPTSHFYIIDNDESALRLLETDFADVAERGNITVYDLISGMEEGFDLHTWQDNVKVMDEIWKRMRLEDWVSIDLLSKIWNYVQEWFIESVFQEDIDDYFLRIRMEKERLKGSKDKDSKSLGALEGWMDWPVINSQYNKNVAQRLLKCPGNLYCISEAQALQKPDSSGKGGDDKGIRELYGSLGTKPAGQKRSGHIMQTVLFFSSNRTGQFKLETVKDRGRARWGGQVFEDFAQDYLVRTSGWTSKMVKVD